MNISRSALISSAFLTVCISSVRAAPIEVNLGGTTDYDGWSSLVGGSGGYAGVSFPGTGVWPTTGSWTNYGGLGAIGSNTPGSSDALLYKISNGAAGGPYPAGSSIYFGGASAQVNLNGGTLGFVDQTPLSGLSTVAFQVEIGQAFGYDFLNHQPPVLTYTTASGTGTLTASFSDLISQTYSGSITMPSGLEDIYKNTWGLQYDLSGIADPILSYQVSFTGVQHAQLYAAQLNESTQAYSDIVFPQAAVWSGLGSGSNWSDAGNWTGGAVPPAGKEVSFGSGGLITLDSSRTTNALNINSPGNVTISGGNNSVLTIGSGGILVNSTIPANHTVGAKTEFSDYSLVTVEAGNSLTFTGDLKAPGFYKKGDGSLNLAGNNTFTGNIYNQLILMGGANSITGTNVNTGESALELYVKDGSVHLHGGDNRLSGDNWALNLYSRRFTNGGTVLSEENGSLILGDASGKSDQTFSQIKADAVNIFDEATGIGTAGTFSNSSIVGGSSAISTLTIDTKTFDPNNTPVFLGRLGGSGANENNLSVVKDGTGVQAFGGTSTYTGDTVIRGGMLRIDSATALSANSNVKLDGGVLGLGYGDFDGTTGSAAGQISFIGDGGFAAYGANRSVTLNSGADLSWAAADFVAEGHKLILSHAGADSTLAFTNSIDLGRKTRTFQIDNGSAATDAELSGVISNGGLRKTGAGDLSLTGMNTYTGGTLIRQGGLTLAGFDGAIRGNVTLDQGTSLALLNNVTEDADMSNGDRLADNAVVTMKGAGFTYKNTSGEQSEAFSRLDLAGGANVLTTASSSSADSFTLNIGQLTRSEGATIHFAAPGLGTDLQNRVILGNAPALDDGILGGWATTGTGTAILATEFVTNGGNGLTALTNYTTTGESTWAASSNVKLTGSSNGITTTLTANRAINSLNLVGARSGTLGNVVNLGGNTLRVESGGIIGSGGASTRSNKITNGTLTAGTGPNTAGELIVTASGATEISASISNNGSGTVSLVKTGVNTLTLNGGSAYTGKTTVNQGTLTIGATGTVAQSSGFLINQGAAMNVALAPNFTVGVQQTMEGRGSVTGPVIIAGTLAGSLNFSNSLALVAGSNVNIGIASEAGEISFDKVTVGGTVTIADLAKLNLVTTGVDFSQSYWQTDRSVLVIATSALGSDYNASNPLQLQSNNAGQGYGNWQVSYGADGVSLKWTAVPEPSALLLGGLGLSSLILRRRRAGKSIIA